MPKSSSPKSTTSRSKSGARPSSVGAKKATKKKVAKKKTTKKKVAKKSGAPRRGGTNEVESLRAELVRVTTQRDEARARVAELEGAQVSSLSLRESVHEIIHYLEREEGRLQKVKRAIEEQSDGEVIVPGDV